MSKLSFVSRIDLIRSKLSSSFTRVAGATGLPSSLHAAARYAVTCQVRQRPDTADWLSGVDGRRPLARNHPPREARPVTSLHIPRCRHVVRRRVTSGSRQMASRVMSYQMLDGSAPGLTEKIYRIYA